MPEPANLFFDNDTLTSIIDVQTQFLVSIEDVEVTYDDYPADKIKAVAGSLEVIRLANKLLIKRIKEDLKD